MAEILQCYDYINKMWETCQNVFIYSDSHFSDADMSEFFNHPSAEEKVARINQVVSRQDCIIFLGDVGDYHWIGQVRAKVKILLCGNHDCGTKKYKRNKYSKKYDKDEYTLAEAKEDFMKLYSSKWWHISHEEGYDMQHPPFKFYQFTADNKLCDYVFSGPLVIGEKVILSHENIQAPGMYNIHGHHHSPDWQDTENRLCICSEKVNFTPLNLKKLLSDGRLKNVKSLHKLATERAKMRHEPGEVW